jgi:SAM-dependent methyltransferase
MKPARGIGAYYTPPDLAAHVVAQTFKHWHASAPALVLDPACGDGAFLSAARKYLGPAAATCLWGVDVDPDAVSTARARFRDSCDTSGAHAKGTVVSIRRGDSLFDGAPFAAPLAKGGFDVIIGNPPWVSLKGRFGSRPYSASRLEQLRRRYGGSTYTPNLAEYFVRRALDLLKPGGLLGFILPDRIALNASFGALRARLVRETTILQLEYGTMFPGVAADTVILVARKKLRQDTDARANDPLATVAPFKRPLPRKQHARAEQIERASTARLGDLCSITSGFGGKVRLITDARSNLRQRPVLRGDSIERFGLRRSYWFDFARANLTGRTCDARKLAARPKLLIRKTGDRLVATLARSGIYPEQSLYFCYDARRGTDFRFILGVLCSELMTDYVRARCLTNPGSFPHLKLEDLRRLPIPRLDHRVPAQRRVFDGVIATVTALLRLHRNIPNTRSAAQQALLESRLNHLVERAFNLCVPSAGSDLPST